LKVSLQYLPVFQLGLTRERLICAVFSHEFGRYIIFTHVVFRQALKLLKASGNWLDVTHLNKRNALVVASLFTACVKTAFTL
jgi:hypothetical protein